MIVTMSNMPPMFSLKLVLPLLIMTALIMALLFKSVDTANTAHKFLVPKVATF